MSETKVAAVKKHKSLARGLIAGLIAGLAATAAKTRVLRSTDSALYQPA